MNLIFVIIIKVYIGKFLNDKKEGEGVYYWPDGSKFIGSFKADKRNGFGRHEYKNGSFFEVRSLSIFYLHVANHVIYTIYVLNIIGCFA